jgi:undecaprenyl-diphosphatase
LVLDALIQLDKEIFLYLNGFHSGFWDNFFWVYTSTTIWIPLYIVIAYVIIKRMGISGIWAIIAIGLTITLCDQVSSSFFKPFFERLRPSREPSLEGLVHLVNNRRGGQFGFISSHAANSFGLAIFTTLLFRKSFFTVFIFMWAILNSYSRIYLGVHYPGDILVGLLLGLLSGWLVYKFYLWIDSKFIGHHREKSLIFNNEVIAIVFAGILSIIIILISSRLLLKLM